MRAVEILAEEHRAIARVLACLEQLVLRTVRSDTLDAEAAGEILEYLERVADGSHQDKEEQVVFPRLRLHASPEMSRSVERLLGEHEEERRVLGQLRANLEGAAYGDAFSRDSFVVLARAYAAKSGEHARWEDEIMLPMARQVLPPSEDAELLAGYFAIEERYFAGRQLGPSEMLKRILERFEVEDRPTAVPIGA